jgi:hypothetical protein
MSRPCGRLPSETWRDRRRGIGAGPDPRRRLDPNRLAVDLDGEVVGGQTLNRAAHAIERTHVDDDSRDVDPVGELRLLRAARAVRDDEDDEAAVSPRTASCSESASRRTLRS